MALRQKHDQKKIRLTVNIATQHRRKNGTGPGGAAWGVHHPGKPAVVCDLPEQRRMNHVSLVRALEEMSVRRTPAGAASQIL